MLLSHWPYFQSPPMGTGYVHSSPPSTLPSLLAVVPRCIAPSANVTGRFLGTSWYQAWASSDRTLRLERSPGGLARQARSATHISCHSQRAGGRSSHVLLGVFPPHPTPGPSGVPGSQVWQEGGSSLFQGTGGGECQCRCIS